METDLKKNKRKYGHKMTLGDTDCEIFSCKYNYSDELIAGGFGDERFEFIILRLRNVNTHLQVN